MLKKDQPIGQLTRGIVLDVLTSTPVHPRGIKVRLTSGQVGRVQHIVGKSTQAAAKNEEFDNFV